MIPIIEYVNANIDYQAIFALTYSIRKVSIYTAFGLGGMEGAGKNKQVANAFGGIAAAGGMVMVAGSVSTLYHGYKATEAALDYSADKMAKLYATMD